jgi:predicted DNA-binding transcriptional regulator AlpA
MDRAYTQFECIAAETSSALRSNEFFLLWTRRDMTKLLACSTRTLSRMVSSHEIPAPIRFARMPRWRVRDIHMWVADGFPGQDPRSATPFSPTFAVTRPIVPPNGLIVVTDFDRFWTRQDLAQRLQFSPRTISRLSAAGLLPRPVKSRRFPRWRPTDIVRWIDQGCLPVDQYRVDG